VSPAGGGVVAVGSGVGLPVGLLVGLPVGDGVPPPPPVVTVTSSKPADAEPVWRPIRPPAVTELVPEPTAVPSTLAVMVEPVTVRLSAYQVPVATVRAAVPSTVTLPLLTACSWACPGSNASR
jgi:hypothetical protein